MMQRIITNNLGSCVASADVAMQLTTDNSTGLELNPSNHQSFFYKKNYLLFIKCLDGGKCL